jgi:hypothetical protein
MWQSGSGIMGSDLRAKASCLLCKWGFSYAASKVVDSIVFDKCKEQVLSLNLHDIVEYKRSVLRLLIGGGGKALNHLYIGAPNSGKTALTRPLLALFGRDAFLKPQVDTSFALFGLIHSKAWSNETNNYMLLVYSTGAARRCWRNIVYCNFRFAETTTGLLNDMMLAFHW